MFHADINDLRCEIYDIKKQSSELKSENQLLKVKVRKLTDEVNKKSRQIANLLDPKKADGLRTLLSQQGVSLIMFLREENSKLLKGLTEKDNLIRKLQNELQVYKLYTEKTKLSTLPEKGLTVPKIDTFSEANVYTTVPTSRTTRSRARSVNTGLRNLSPSPCNKQPAQSKQSLLTCELKSITDLEKSYHILLNNNLKTIKEFSIRKGNPHQESESPALNSTQSTSPNELPHIEIQQLQSHFMNVLSELDYLKAKVIELEAEQTKSDQPKNQCNTQNINGNEKLSENRDLKTEESNGSNTEFSNTIEIETESNGSIYDEGSISSAAKILQNTPTGPDKKSVSVQTTKYFCVTPLSSDKRNYKANKFNSSLKYENDLEVQYTN